MCIIFLHYIQYALSVHKIYNTYIISCRKFSTIIKLWHFHWAVLLLLRTRLLLENHFKRMTKKFFRLFCKSFRKISEPFIFSYSYQDIFENVALAGAQTTIYARERWKNFDCLQRLFHIHKISVCFWNGKVPDLVALFCFSILWCSDYVWFLVLLQMSLHFAKLLSDESSKSNENLQPFTTKKLFTSM